MTVSVASPAWTAEQLDAMRLCGQAMLVTASAGSGKTAVLTERVLRLILGAAGDAPAAPLDRLLIITFTEKAAREMRERIERRLREALKENPTDARLLDALERLPGAWIATIDAFCRRIVLEHFHQAGITPSPRLLEAAEQTQLEYEWLREMCEERAATEGENLEDLICACGHIDTLLQELRILIRFLESLDDAEGWSARVTAQLQKTLATSRYEDLPDVRIARGAFVQATHELTELLRDVIALARASGGEPACLKRWNALADELDRRATTETLFRPDGWMAWLEGEPDATLGKLQNKGVCGAALFNDKSFNTEFLERFAKRYQHWREEWFALDEAGLLRGAHLAAAQALALLELAREGMERMQEARRRRGVVTFNDFERLALKILTDPVSGRGPSAVARQLQELFCHVLVDEYQDTSLLQDAIIQCVCRGADFDENGANLFMVGDYKQSIYRFRQAAPALFLARLRDEATHVVPLARNFRSRLGILAFVNACFQRLMDEQVGDIEYGAGERLLCGRDEPESGNPVCVEVQWLAGSGYFPQRNNGGEAEENTEPESGVLEELTGVEAQACWIAERIRELTDGRRAMLIPDANNPGQMRRLVPGDCAILVRSLRGELDVWLRTLARIGLRAQAPGLNPLFTRPELMDLTMALRAVDNPLQDFPLAALMRSPLAGFTDDELLVIRMQQTGGPFHEAVWVAAGRRAGDVTAEIHMPAALELKLTNFMENLNRWRELARRGTPLELLEKILLDTDYEAHMIGHRDGLARLEHVDFLRALLTRLGRAEDGANPLHEFLRLLERAESEEGGELGELPERITPDADAVTLLTMHRAKGLEFPVVFLPRLERPFHGNTGQSMLCERELGMARYGIDLERRCRFATPGMLAIRHIMRRQDRSEELRLLYVAMTRARERLVLVGQLSRARHAGDGWGLICRLDGAGAPALERLTARSPADLLGPIIEYLRVGTEPRPDWLHVGFDAQWQDAPCSVPMPMTIEENADQLDLFDADLRPAVCAAQPLRLLPSLDPGAILVTAPAKLTVTELRRQRERAPGDGEWLLENDQFLEQEMRPAWYTRQRSLEERSPQWARGGDKQLDAARCGTLTHALLANLDLSATLDLAGVRAQLEKLWHEGRLSAQDLDLATLKEHLPLEAIAWFFTTDAGRRMRERPQAVLRELPFSRRMAVRDLDPDAGAAFPSETVLLQGMIDAAIDEGQSVFLIDYKTDRLLPETTVAQLVERHRLQMIQYMRALQTIWQIPSVTAGLVLLEPRMIEWIDDEES